MRAGWRVVLFLAVAACFLFLARPLRAGDCGSPDDCGRIPDNGTEAACGLGILAGFGLYQRSRKNQKTEEHGSADATDEDLLFGGGAPAQNASTSSPAGGGGAHHGPPDGPLGDPGDLSGGQ